MVIPHASLPMTLKGVGGVKLINMPGVKYPDSVISGRRGTVAGSGKPYACVPESGIRTREAAEILELSVRSTRVLLNRKNVECYLVSEPGGRTCMYWNRRMVEHLAARQGPLVQKMPEKLCTAKEACYILLVARSSLSRYVQRGLLKEYAVRYVSKTGVRRLSCYMRAEVRKLAGRLNAARTRAQTVQKERLQTDWYQQRDSVSSRCQAPNS